MIEGSMLHARISRTVVVTVLAMLALLLGPPVAHAADDVGYAGPGYSGASYPPTSEKPQSKLWYAGGSWWGDLYVPNAGWRIHRWDRPSHTWVDTGVTNDTRYNALPDVLWDGSKLYIASNRATLSGDVSTSPAKPGQPTYLYRYSFANGTYTLDPGFPTTIQTFSTEALTIDKDSQGRIWATWTQVAQTSTGYTSTVYANVSSVGGTSWGTPFVLPTADPQTTPDDVAAIVAFSGRIGVMWTDQAAGAVRMAIHADSSAPESGWTTLNAISGTDLADDHLNLKSLDYDGNGHVVAVSKTSLDKQSDKTQPQLVMHVFTVSTARFATYPVARVIDCVTRPQVILERGRNMVHIAYTATSSAVAGCPYSGTSGSIWMKSTEISNPSFPVGRGTLIMEDADSANLNNVTSSKQSVDSYSGLVLLASQQATKQYWTADIALGAPPPQAPVASFTATPSTGEAPLSVAFRDTSTGTPTSWTWDFGDGTTSTAQHPSHTYTDAGTYTVALTATNAGGSATTSQSVVVTQPPPPPPPATTPEVVGTSQSASDGTSRLTIPAVAEARAGNVLVASLVGRKVRTVRPPSGWTLVRSTLLADSSQLVTFTRVASASEPSSYRFSFDRSRPAVGTIVAASGVSTTNPVDVSAGATSRTATSTYAAPSVTPTVGGGLLLTLFGPSAATTIEPPAAMTERSEVKTSGSIALPVTLGSATATLDATPAVTDVRNATGGAGAEYVSQSLVLRPAG